MAISLGILTQHFQTNPLESIGSMMGSMGSMCLAPNSQVSQPQASRAGASGRPGLLCARIGGEAKLEGSRFLGEDHVML